MISAPEKLSAKLLVTDLPCESVPGALLKNLAQQKDPVMLDSSALGDQFGRYTILTCQPIDVITIRGETLTDRAGSIIAEGPDAIWDALANAFGGIDLAEADSPRSTPYLPGWFGYVGYEIGRLVENLPHTAVRDTALPDLRLGFYDAVLVYDALGHRWQIMELVFDLPPAGAGKAGLALREVIATPHGTESRPTPPHLADATALELPGDAVSNFARDDYLQAVAKCVDYITAGDIFQVNLSQRITVPQAPEPLDIYRALRRRNPAWHAAYMSFESQGRQCAVLSSSPELFLRVRDGKVLTRPIKGTRRRTGDAEADKAAAADLLASAKDNAELAMIIDLMRNDLGRVCKFGSLRVTEPCRLETHPTVFHLVGTVEGELRDEIGPAELLKATFPGGSITGAPKIRAMQIIDELEPSARSVYTGCVGTVGVDGTCEWNIAIRTMICDGRSAHIQVGGGIVADSTPEGEHAETLDKARAMLEAIQQARKEKLTTDS